MTRKLLTVDEFRAADQAARGEVTVMRVAAGDPEEAGELKLRFVFSDGTVDRMGDKIDPAGWDMADFMANPVALWAHDSSSPPIGRASNVGPVGSKLMGDIEFTPRDISAFGYSIYQMAKARFIKAVSVGFLPIEWKFVQDNKRPYGIDFIKQALLEISVCPVPCNPNALLAAKAAGIDTGPVRDWASRLLDDGAQVMVPRSLLEETFRQAKTPRTIRQKYLAKSEAPDWSCAAAKDLPVETEASWDGAAAAKRMLDAAGFDGDSPDAAKAARGFLICDKANPALRSSYKLPFADIVGGELKAIKGGIAAAKGRLDQTEAPPASLDDASAVLDGYEDAISKTAPEPVVKAGRRISAANEEMLRKAMDHHASATECIKAVLASNADDEPDDDPDDMTVNPGKTADKTTDQTTADGPKPTTKPTEPMTEAEKRAQRLAEARALKAAVKA